MCTTIYSYWLYSWIKFYFTKNNNRQCCSYKNNILYCICNVNVWEKKYLRAMTSWFLLAYVLHVSVTWGPFFLQEFQWRPSHLLHDKNLPLEERYMHHSASWQFILQKSTSSTPSNEIWQKSEFSEKIYTVKL